jgi:hypothetical protein
MNPHALVLTVAVDRDGRTRIEITRAGRNRSQQQLGELGPSQALDANAHDRRAGSAADREERVEVGVQRHDHAMLRSRCS